MPVPRLICDSIFSAGELEYMELILDPQIENKHHC